MWKKNQNGFLVWINKFIKIRSTQIIKRKPSYLVQTVIISYLLHMTLSMYQHKNSGFLPNVASF